MHVSEDLPSRWADLIDEICSQRVDSGRAANIVDEILADGPDVLRRELVDSFEDWSPALLPVERLHLFVARCLETLRNESTSSHTYDQSQYKSLCQIRSLLSAVLYRRHVPRSLSQIERAALSVQYADVDFHCELTRPDRPQQNISERLETRRLASLERAVALVMPSLRNIREDETVPSSLLFQDPQLERIRNAWLYRKVRWQLRSGNVSVAMESLRHLLRTPHVLMKAGAYLGLASGVILDLKTTSQSLEPDILSMLRSALSSTRMSLARAFALLPAERVPDRFGLVALMALDALYSGATKRADDLRTLLSRIAERLPAQTSNTAAGLRLALHTLAPERHESSNHSAAEVSQLERCRAAVPATVRATLASNSGRSTSALSVWQPDSDDRVLTLYRGVLFAWLTRTPMSSECNEVISHILGTELRDDSELCRLSAIAQLCRVLDARGRDQIDAAIHEYERQLGVLVLSQNWQALINTMLSWGHHNFLRKLGLNNESRSLVQLAEHLCYLLDLDPLSDEQRRLLDRQSAEQIELDLFAAPISGPASSQFRNSLDRIEGRWRVGWGQGGRANAGQELAESFRDRAREFQKQRRTNSEVKEFFEDLNTIKLAAAQLPNIESETDRIPILRALAFSAQHFSRILKVIGYYEPRPMEQYKWWRARGISWADECIRLSEIHSHWAMLYAALEARVQLEDIGRWDIPLREKLRRRMLDLDLARHDTTCFSQRRHRSVMKAERTLVEVMHPDWCRSFQRFVGLEEIPWLTFLQRLKTLNYPELARESEEDRGPGDDLELISDGDPAFSPRAGWEAALANHLNRENAAVLEFVTHPNLRRGVLWDDDLQTTRHGSVCLVFRCVDRQLKVRPFRLAVTENLVRACVEGDHTGFEGIRNTLFCWPDESRHRFPKAMATLGANLFSDELLAALDGVKRIYLCPHRHLFELPIHALPLSDGTYPIERWDISYALKVNHIAKLVERGTVGRTSKWSVLADTAEFPDAVDELPPEISGINQWGESGLGIEEILRPAPVPRQVVVFCHGQMDEARPSRARLRLWGGGRLTAEDIRRIARDAEYDQGNTEWLIAACESAANRIGMQTAPGLSLTLALAGARRVTSCLTEVTPETAVAFVKRFLQASYSESCRALVREIPGTSGWATAASFVSYGVFETKRNSGECDTVAPETRR